MEKLIISFEVEYDQSIISINSIKDSICNKLCQWADSVNEKNDIDGFISIQDIYAVAGRELMPETKFIKTTDRKAEK